MVKVKVEKVLEKIVEYAVYGLVFIIPFSKAGIEIFGITAIGGWILLKGLSLPACKARIRGKGLRIKSIWFFFIKRPVFMALTVFLIINLLSCITSVAIGHSIRAFFTKTVEYILFFFIALEVCSKYKKLKKLIVVLLISIGVLSLDGLIQNFLGIDLIRHNIIDTYYHRITASFGCPNNFSNYLVLFITLLLGLCGNKKYLLKWRILIFFMFLSAVFCTIFSYTRASWLGLLIGMMVFSFLKNKKLFILFIIILSITFLFLPSCIKTRLQQEDTLEQEYGNFRIAVWKEALNILYDYPVLGTGLNTYTLVGPNYKKHYKGGIYPHNSYLHMAAELGLLGLISFLWFLICLFMMSCKLLRHLQHFKMKGETSYILILGLTTGLLSFLVNAFFDTTLYSIKLASIFWIMCGVLVAMCNVAEERI